MRGWEKKKKAARDLVRCRPELGTDGGAPSVVRRAVGLTSAPIKVDDPETRKLPICAFNGPTVEAPKARMT
jgi:hypothetical protein